MKSAKIDQSIRLPDGRQLGYAEYGVPAGIPVLFFHGSPGASHIHADMADASARHGIRLVAVDRPGYGISTPQTERSIPSWAADVLALADTLGIARFAIIGFSGACPYALACAYKLADRVTKVVLAGALAPLNAPGMMACLPPMVSGLFALAQSNPAELRQTFATLASSPAALLEVVSATAIAWDKQMLHERAAEFEIEYTRMLQSGIEGLASDYVLASGAWGFPLNGINTEVHLWCGSADQNTPPAMTHYLASQLRNSHTHILEDEGHYALYGHWEEILKSVK